MMINQVMYLNINYLPFIKSTGDTIQDIKNLSVFLYDVSCQSSGEWLWSGKQSSSSWHFVLMDEALGQRQSSGSLFLIASMQKDESEPSAAVASQEENRGRTSVGSPAWARKSDWDLLELIRKDIQFQEEKAKER